MARLELGEDHSKERKKYTTEETIWEGWKDRKTQVRRGNKEVRIDEDS